MDGKGKTQYDTFYVKIAKIFVIIILIKLIKVGIGLILTALNFHYPLILVQHPIIVAVVSYFIVSVIVGIRIRDSGFGKVMYGILTFFLTMFADFILIIIFFALQRGSNNFFE